jgi:hypothetical protein
MVEKKVSHYNDGSFSLVFVLLLLLLVCLVVFFYFWFGLDMEFYIVSILHTVDHQQLMPTTEKFHRSMPLMNRDFSLHFFHCYLLSYYHFPTRNYQNKYTHSLLWNQDTMKVNRMQIFTKSDLLLRNFSSVLKAEPCRIYLRLRICCLYLDKLWRFLFLNLCCTWVNGDIHYGILWRFLTLILYCSWINETFTMEYGDVSGLWLYTVPG